MMRSRKNTIIALFLVSILFLVSPLPYSLLHQTLISSFFFFFTSVLCDPWWPLSAFDNQDSEEAVNGWAEDTRRNDSFSQWSFMQLFVFCSFICHAVTRSVTLCYVLMICSYSLSRAVTVHTHAAVADNAIFSLMNQLGALLWTVWLFKPPGTNWPHSCSSVCREWCAFIRYKKL